MPENEFEELPLWRAGAVAEAIERPGAGGFFSDGILSETLLATETGWRPAGELAPGDVLLSFDHGPVILDEVHRTLAGVDPGAWPEAHWPLLIPDAALDNRGQMRLTPEQLVVVETDLADRLFGDPFALLPARALAGWRGIAPARPAQDEVAVLLGFGAEQVIYACSGLLLYCHDPAADQITTVTDQGWAAGRSGNYAPLSLASARHLVTCLIAEDVGANLSLPAPSLLAR